LLATAEIPQSSRGGFNRKKTREETVEEAPVAEAASR